MRGISEDECRVFFLCSQGIQNQSAPAISGKVQPNANRITTFRFKENSDNKENVLLTGVNDHVISQSGDCA